MSVENIINLKMFSDHPVTYVSLFVALHINRSVFLSQGSYTTSRWCHLKPIIQISASWLTVVSERSCLASADKCRSIEASTPGVIISSALTWPAAAVMFKLVPCRSAVKTDVFSHFVYRRLFTAALHMLRVNCLSYPPCLFLHSSSQSCGQWLRRSYLLPVQRLMLLSMLLGWLIFPCL